MVMRDDGAGAHFGAIIFTNHGKHMQLHITGVLGTWGNGATQGRVLMRRRITDAFTCCDTVC